MFDSLEAVSGFDTDDHKPKTLKKLFSKKMVDAELFSAFSFYMVPSSNSYVMFLTKNIEVC